MTKVMYSYTFSTRYKFHGAFISSSWLQARPIWFWAARRAGAAVLNPTYEVYKFYGNSHSRRPTVFLHFSFAIYTKTPWNQRRKLRNLLGNSWASEASVFNFTPMVKIGLVYIFLFIFVTSRRSVERINEMPWILVGIRITCSLRPH